MPTRSPRVAFGQAAAARARRADGNQTRLHILETAGQVFAELGYANTTSKEICTRAGANMAAVNYHFGGKDGLYEAVLIQAHQQIVSLDELADLAGLPDDPRLKLRTVLAHLLELGARPSAPWGFRVMLREAMSPSPLVPALIRRAIQPKARLLLGLIGQIVGLPADHPAVQGGLVFTVLPCVLMTIAPRELGNRVLPALKNPELLLDTLMHYVNGGLDALARAHGPQR